MPTASQYRDLIAKSPTLRSFLNFIGWAEGADYNIGYGNRIFYGYSNHPYNRGQFKLIDPISKRPSTTSAAGKYQYQRGTWDSISKQLGLTDFSPANQDIGAVKLIDDAGALNDVLRGNITSAISKLGNVWQSFETRSQSSLLSKWNLMAGTSPYNVPQNVEISDFDKFKNVKVFSEQNRYFIAFAILVIIFIFAFN